MDRDTVAPNFQKAVRRTFTIGSSHHHNGGTNEDTPLLGTENAGGANGHHGHSKTFEFFLNSHYTPGMDSENTWVKVPANVWHITKATLLSSESTTAAAAAASRLH